MTKEENARIIATELDRLAYIVDPYEYWDVIGGRDIDSIRRHEREIALDLLAGNVRPYAEWLRGLISDAGTARNDRKRAAARLARLNKYAARYCTGAALN